jgi:alpha-L-fucosidase
VNLGKQQSFNVVSLVEPVGRMEDYKESRIKSYKFQRWDGAGWSTIAEGGTPEPVTIRKVTRASAERVRLIFEASQDTPHIAEIGVYNEPS